MPYFGVLEVSLWGRRSGDGLAFQVETASSRAKPARLLFEIGAVVAVKGAL